MIDDMLYNIENNISFAALIDVMEKKEKCCEKICFNNNKFYQANKHTRFYYKKVTKEEFIKLLNNIFSIVEYNPSDIFERTSYNVRKKDLKEADLEKRNDNLRVLGVIS